MKPRTKIQKVEIDGKVYIAITKYVRFVVADYEAQKAQAQAMLDLKAE